MTWHLDGGDWHCRPPMSVSHAGTGESKSRTGRNGRRSTCWRQERRKRGVTVEGGEEQRMGIAKRRWICCTGWEANGETTGQQDGVRIIGGVRCSMCERCSAAVEGVEVERLQVRRRPESVPVLLPFTPSQPTMGWILSAIRFHLPPDPARRVHFMNSQLSTSLLYPPLLIRVPC